MLQHGPHSGRVGVSFNVHCYIWNAFIVVINYNHVCSMPGSREEDFNRTIIFSLYDLYGHTLAQEPLPRGS